MAAKTLPWAWIVGGVVATGAGASLVGIGVAVGVIVSRDAPDASGDRRPDIAYPHDATTHAHELDEANPSESVNPAAPPAERTVAAPEPASALEESPTSSPTFARRDVHRALDRAHPQIQACYRRFTHPIFHRPARLRVDFDVDPTGRPRRVRIGQSTSRNPRFHACILDVVRPMRFDPAPERAAHFRVPLYLRRR